MLGMATKPNTNELGNPGGIQASYGPRGQKQYVAEPLEMNWELQFPQSIPIYDAMRTQDGHIGSILSAVTLPIIGAKWDLLTDGVDERVVKLVRSELGLSEVGKPRQRRRREGISFYDHIEQAIDPMLWAGFSAFEQVYQVGKPRPGQEDIGLENIVHLRKLAPRLPRTITQFNVDRDGGLAGIQQTAPDGGEDVVIPVRQLVMYVNRKEGADWSGRSVLRQAYKHWLIKDIFLKLDAQAAERNSMGIPVITYADQSNKAEAEDAVQQLRAGSNAGLALPPTSNLEIKGVSGGTVDLIPRIKYHDQEMARSALAMFLDLGHDAGSYSLGEVHLNVFLSSVQTIADRIAETATEHVIRDLVEYNFGPEEPYPVLTAGDLRSNQDVNAEIVNTLAGSGILVPDDKLEAFLRTRYNLPEKGTPRKSAEPAVAPAPVVPGAVPSETPTAADNKVVQLPTGTPGTPSESVTAARGVDTSLDRATVLMGRLLELQKGGH